MTFYNNKIDNAIFGFTGLVGSNLIKFYNFHRFYNSTNIKEAIGKKFNNIFICCIPAVKWYANKYPDIDIEEIENIKAILTTMQANKVFLISTIDIYDNTSNQSNENSIVNYEQNHYYGRNRYLFEEFIKLRFNDYIIIRLPALFGNGLKKNMLYDLLNNNDVDKIIINSRFQWYNLDWLKKDIDICVKNKLKICNFFTEPLNTSDIITLFPQYNYNNNPKNLLIYDVKTINFLNFPNGKNGYIRTKEEVYESIQHFVTTKQHINNFVRFILLI